MARLTLSGALVGTALNLIFWLDHLFTELGRLIVASVFLTVFTADWILERFEAPKPAARPQQSKGASNAQTHQNRPNQRPPHSRRRS